MILQKLHWAVLAVGVAVLAAAVVGAAKGWNSTGEWAIAIIGAACLLIALVAHRLIDVTIKRGETTIGFTLDHEVREDLTVTGLTGAAGIYSFVHNQLAAEDPGLFNVKVHLQDELVKMVKDNAFSQPVGAAKVDQVLSSGSSAERVLVFGVLQGDRELATVERLRKGIMESKSGNEQYHALLATLTHWDAFSKDEQQLLRKDVQAAPYINRDPDRMKLADEISAREEARD